MRPRRSARHDRADAAGSKRSLRRPPGDRQRQQDFERHFGKAAKAGTLSRFLKTDLDSSQEVLVDPKNVVPVETNTLRNGKLMAHRTFAYGAAPDGAVVRRSVHAETLASPDTGDRAVVDTTFSNIRLELRR